MTDRLTLPGGRLRPKKRGRHLQAMLVGTMAVAGVASATWADWGLFVVAAAGLSVPLGLLEWQRYRAVAGGQGLAADARGLWVDGQLALPRSEMRRALVVIEQGTALVLLERPPLAITATEIVEGLSEPEAHALVAALGLDATATTSEFTFDSSATESVHPFLLWLYLLVIPLLGLGALIAGVPGWVMLALMMVWYAGLIAASMPKKLVVGLDGLLVRWMGRRRLVRYDELSAVEHDGKAIRLRLRDGSTVRLSTYWLGQAWGKGRWKQVVGFGSREAYLETVAARIAEAQAASLRGGGSAAAAWLSQGSREARQWVGELRQLLAPRGGFREGAPGVDDLWAALEDQRQPGATRAAAAVALAPSLDEPGRHRLRLAASTVVDPSLRDALAAGERDDDEALLAALDNLDARKPRGGRHGE